MLLHSALSQPPPPSYWIVPSSVSPEPLRRPESGRQVGYILAGFWLHQVTSETGGSMFLQGFMEVSEKHCSPIQLSTVEYEMLFWSSFHGSFKSLPTSSRPSHRIPRLQPLSVYYQTTFVMSTVLRTLSNNFDTRHEFTRHCSLYLISVSACSS